ncbi:phosphate uptake regulator PhoU [Firmicutes bacterium CAG:345]|jgi:phosphate transport system regulatory protein phoU|nr:phosphate uptake regulator PhoU [Firmicutes bacterium CAG:345]
MSIRKKYFVELEEINQKLLLMQKKVISAIQESINALLNKDSLLIEDTFRKEKEIDSLERDIEQECLKILLMEHPVAGDFREVSAALKMITDLERIGDNARDICEIALQFNGKTYIKRLEHIPEMAKNAIAMVKDSVQSYIDQDLELARGLDKRDDRVDDLFEIVKKDLILLIKLDSSSADDAIMILMIAKYLERIADHAVNIGEWVDYCITGSHQ